MRKSNSSPTPKALAAIIFFITLCLFINPINADDHLDAIPAEGLVLSPEIVKQIKLQKQKIKIAHDNVEFEYTFLNTSDKSLEGHVHFILPPTPHDYPNPDSSAATWDVTYYQLMKAALQQKAVDKNYTQEEKSQDLEALASAKKELAPYLNFVITVDGKQITPKHEMTAKLGNKDISPILIKNKIPLSADFVNAGGSEGLILSWFPDNTEIKKKLADLKLLDQYQNPVWKNQSIYSWNQTFPANKTVKITLSYNPANGLTYLYPMERGDNKESYEKKVIEYYDNLNLRYNGVRKIKDFSPSTEVIEFIRSFITGDVKTDNGILLFREVEVVPYQINLAAMNEFELEIIPPKKGEIAVVWTKPLKKMDNKYTVQHKNFNPPKVIDVLFIGG